MNSTPEVKGNKLPTHNIPESISFDDLKDESFGFFDVNTTSPMESSSYFQLPDYNKSGEMISRSLSQSWWDKSGPLTSSMLLPNQSLQDKVEIEKRFRKTLRLLNLDTSQTRGCLLSWAAGLLLIIIVPLIGYFLITPSDNEPSHQLPFRVLTYILQSSLSGVSFLFLHSTVRKHGLLSVLFLDVASEENFSVQLEYENSLKSSTTLLSQVFLPAFLLHLIQKLWLFIEVPLVLLPFDFFENYKVIEEVVVFIITSLSWIFESYTFLFACVIFWKVCCLQELKMMEYREMLRKCSDPAYCFREYSRIIHGLSVISHRFRLFLALTMSITLLGGLASMYEMVVHGSQNLTFFNSGDLVVANWIGLMGTGLCLRSASKIAHLHRRIVKVGYTMHAQHTYTHVRESVQDADGEEFGVMLYVKKQEEWMLRSSLVNYLANTTAGISVYGFVLDRTFVHTSFGALLTTTWFILGQSISGS